MFASWITPGAIADSPTTRPPDSESTPNQTAEFESRFRDEVLPMLDSRCVDCHGPDDPQGGLDLTAFKTLDDVVKHYPIWETVRRRVADGEMPPEDSGDSLDDAERGQVTIWVDDILDDYAKRHAGQPGIVLTHRLSVAEYNHTIRDLTGVDIQPAKTFPVDPTNPAGFANTGESLMMTPALLEKYIAAARTVADHLILGSSGLHFAPHPVVTDTDRDRYCVQRIVDFYAQFDIDIANYLQAAIEFRQRRSAPDLAVVAANRNLSPTYLQRVNRWLDTSAEESVLLRPILGSLSECIESNTVNRERIEAIAEDIRDLRQQLTFEFPHLRVEGMNRGSQPLVLWRNRQKASHRMKPDLDKWRALVAAQSPGKKTPGNSPRDLKESQAAIESFCEVFPDRFFVDRRGREYVKRRKQTEFEKESEFRLLSAGFHSMMGYFRDDQPLVQLMLNDDQRRRLNDLWFDLNFVANVPSRQHSGFVWFERAEGRYLVDAEFDAFQAADKDLDSPEKIAGLRDAYLAKAKRLGADQTTLDAIEEHFQRVEQSIREVEAARGEAVAMHLVALERIADRAFRRSLTEAEKRELTEFYFELVQNQGFSHEEAIRDVLVSVLVSPHFCFRITPTSEPQLSASDSRGPEKLESTASGVPLDDVSLASRLSYFLWSSMPDDRLRELADRRELRDLAVLRAELQRMLDDPKSRGLAVEFGGHWLGFHDFAKHQGVDRQRYRHFDESLKAAMFEEPVRLLQDIINSDRSVLDLLYANDTFVNRTLADHYGMPFPDAAPEGTWVKIADANRYGRGGVLPMAVFLTKHSPGLRTSPVKRGYWVVRDLLGTSIPAPPPGVPELPEDESELGDRTLRELLAAHRADPSCATCHDKFDSFGLVFEAYDPIGQIRDKDFGGRPVQTQADFPDKIDRDGVDGLREYLRQGRDADFVRTFCKRLLAYGLGRSLILSDRPLVDAMVGDVRSGNDSFRNLIWRVVQSPQFRHRQVKP
ncbi:MAG: DUF1592 domain-containing protein [Planctomycetota bacterium]